MKTKEQLTGLLRELSDKGTKIQRAADMDARDLSEREQRQIAAIYTEFVDAEAELMANFPEVVYDRSFLDGMQRSRGRKAEPEGPEPQQNIAGGEILGRRSGPQARITGGAALDRTFKGMFPDVVMDSGGFKSPDEFLEVFNSGRFDPRLVRNTHVEGEGGSGGFSVPVQYSSQWLDISLIDEVVRPRAQVWPMTSKTRLIPGWDLLDMSGGASFGGFEIQWLAEEGTADQQTGKIRQIELSAKKGAIFTQVSNELMADGLGFEAQLSMALVRSITYGFDRAFLRGTGGGQPIGVLSASSLITVDAETGQDADTIVYSNLSKMFARMYPGGKKRAVWVANDDTLPQLLQISIPIGLSGQFYPVMTESNGQYSIFGRPVIFTPVMSSLGDFGDIALIDFTAYAIGLRKDMSIDRDQAPGWSKDLDSWRTIVRLDGMPTWNTVFTPENGATMSWAVALAERAG